MRGKNCHVILRMMALLAFVTSVEAIDEPIANLRIWKDRTGQHSVEAELMGCDNSLVRLKKADGTTISIPLKQLSNADKWFIRKEMKSKKGQAPAANKPVLESKKTDSTVNKTKQLDLRQAKRQIDIKRLFGVDWHQSPESFQATSKLDASPKPIMWFRVLGDLEGFM